MAVQGRGEFRSTSEKGEGLIQGVRLPPTRVRFSDLSGLALFEGDILLGRTSDLQSAREQRKARMTGMGAVIVGETYRWPDGVVPYQLATDLAAPQRVRDAIAHWAEETPLRFVERVSKNANAYPDYVSFENGDGCMSYVGRQGGKQEVWLAAACTTGNAIHELGHTVGLWHEQSRADRDQYVEVHLENVVETMLDNFDQHVTDGDDVGPYDYGSIMHYPRDAFSRNGRDTIVPKGGQAIGQRVELSGGDVDAVRALYGK